MQPELFKIGPIPVNGYGTMIALGIAVAILLSMKRAKKRGIEEEPIIDIAIYGILGGVLGAKLLFILTELPNIIKNPSVLPELIKSGFVLYGAIIGGALAALIYCKRKGKKFLQYFDLIAPSIAIAQGFGRIGCFLAGCCYGKETNSPIGVVFNNALSFAPHGVKVHPTQLYSSIGDFIIAATLLYFAAKPRKNGQVAGLYMILYSIGRFAVEFFRGDPRGNIFFLSTSQFICIFVLIGGIILLNTENFKAPASHH